MGISEMRLYRSKSLHPFESHAHQTVDVGIGGVADPASRVTGLGPVMAWSNAHPTSAQQGGWVWLVRISTNLTDSVLALRAEHAQKKPMFHK